MKNKKIERKLSPVKRWLEKRFWWVVIGVTVVAAGVCLAIGLQQSVWFDEAYSVMVAKQPVGEILRLSALDTHPPLYYLVLHAWMALFGTGEAAIRSLSVIGYAGTIISAVWIMRRWFGARAAWITLALAVVSPLIMRYGFEVRMYALASFIGVAATGVLFIARERKASKWWVLYAVLVAVGTATLYNLVYVWVTHLIWQIVVDKKEKRLSLKASWIWSYGLSIALFAPLLPAFYSQLHNGALAAISEPMTLENILGIVTFNTVYQPAWELNAWISLVVIAVLLSLIALVVYGWRQIAKLRPEAWLLGMYLLVPIILLTLVSLIRPLYVERYLSHVAIGGVMAVALLASLVWQNHARVARWAVGTIIFASVIGVVTLAMTGNFNFQRMQYPNVEAVASQISCADGAIVTPDPYTAIELQYYLPSCPIHFYAPWDTLRGGYAPLNKSPLQSTSQEMSLSEQKIYFVYYDGLGVVFPGYESVASPSTEPLHVQIYQRP